MPLKDSVVTFAEVLRKRGYATSYLGKRHLDGDAMPGWAPPRKFGFSDNRFMFNRGHWKNFEMTKDGPRVEPERITNQLMIWGDADEKSFATDWLVDRSLEILERDKNKPFCMMLALPDPHGPNTVREPYDSMYDHFVFKQPVTMRKVLAALLKPAGVDEHRGRKIRLKKSIRSRCRIILGWFCVLMIMLVKSFVFLKAINWIKTRLLCSLQIMET